jgi:electron transport complex protein RnfC
MLGFRGGVHPKEHKHSTEHKPVEAMPLPGRAWLPMSQHTGAPSKPLVAKGDEVKTGQVIGEAGGAISVPTHASVSGKVADVVPLPHPLFGRRVPTVVIDSDGNDTLCESIGERDYSGFSRDQVLEAIRAAGIVGLGGAAFPTHFKLNPPKEKKIDCLLVNGCECEPFLTADHRVMLEQPEEMVEGVRIIARALGVERVIIAVEDNKPDAIDRVRSAAGDIEVRRLKTKYPQGAEKQLIKACLGREVPSGGLPMDVGCVVQNVGTAVAVRDALRFARPLIERVVTVTGPAVNEPKNLRCRIGTPVRELIAACGGYRGEPAKLIMGGPMMGIAVSTDDIPVLKGTSGVLVLDAAAAAEPAEHDCIRCGSCIRACPMGLAPQRLYYHVIGKRLDAAERDHVMDCIECGCCAFACPAKLRLVQRFKYAKSEIQAKRAKK